MRENERMSMINKVNGQMTRRYLFSMISVELEDQPAEVVKIMRE